MFRVTVIFIKIIRFQETSNNAMIHHRDLLYIKINNNKVYIHQFLDRNEEVARKFLKNY